MTVGSGVRVQGNDEARQARIAGLYEQHFRGVWRRLMALGVPDADLEDVTHDVFLTAYQGLDAFQGRSSARTWLFGIAFNLATGRMRRASARREVLDGACDEHLADAPGPERVVGEGQVMAALDRALAELPAEQREVFLLFEVEGMTGSAIAALTNVPVQTVFTRLRLARARVAREIQPLTSEGDHHER